MISSKEIVSKAKNAVKKCGTRNPFEIAKMCRVEIISKELGTLKGFYKIIYRNAFIFLNSRLSMSEAKIVCAHELGHHALHKEFARIGFEEFSLFDESSRREYEANLFAAELLISNSDVKELIEAGYTEEQIATSLGIDKKLLELKLKFL